MFLTLPNLEPHERTDLTAPEILRRTLGSILEQLHTDKRGHEQRIVNHLSSITHERGAIVRLDAEIAEWERLLAHLDAQSADCSLCQGEGCSYDCGRPTS